MRDEKQTTIHPDGGPVGDAPPPPPASGVPAHERILAVATAACLVLGLGAAAGVQAAEQHQPEQPVAATTDLTPTPAAPAPQPTPAQAAPAPATAPSPSASSALSEPPSGPPSVTAPVDGVAWDAVSYPLDCGQFGYRVQFVTQAVDLMHNGGREAAVAVTCAGNGGSPPSAVYVYRLEPSGQGLAALTPAATLLTPDEHGYIVTALNADADGVTFDTVGYSSDSVVRSSPDLHAEQHWAWTGHAFARVG